MQDYQIGNGSSLYLLAVVAVVTLVVVSAGFSRRRAVKRFATANLRRKLMMTDASGRRVSSMLAILALALLTISLMDLRWGKTRREVPQKGIEVVFLLDVSRSMLAEDVAPNRLARAKQQISDVVEEMAGDRIGLVVFAGDHRQAVPLTSHYDDFKQTLETVGPHSVRRGGSRLGDAILAASEAFLGKTNDHKAVVVFTDGEDQESEPIEVAKNIYAENGIRVFAVGLGDFEQGARIPDTQTRRRSYIEHEGQQVWSKLNGQILEQIAMESDGAYIPAGTKRVNMSEVYHRYIADVEQAEFESAKIDAYKPRFQWFAIPALALLFVDVVVSSRRKRVSKKVNKDSSSQFSHRNGQKKKFNSPVNAA